MYSQQVCHKSKKGVVVNMPEGPAAMKRDTGRLEKWTIKNLTKFNKGKRKVKSLCRNYLTYQYLVGAIQLESCFSELYVGVLVDTHIEYQPATCPCCKEGKYYSQLH